MLEPQKPGDLDPNNGAQSGTRPAGKEQKPGMGEQAPDQAGLAPKQDQKK